MAVSETHLDQAGPKEQQDGGNPEQRRGKLHKMLCLKYGISPTFARDAACSPAGQERAR